MHLCQTRFVILSNFAPVVAPMNPKTVHKDRLVSQKRLQGSRSTVPKHESPAPKNPETVHKGRLVSQKRLQWSRSTVPKT